MENLNQEKTLSYAEYDRLCREACHGFLLSGSKEADEEALLHRICRTVFAYLDQEFLLSPIVDATNVFSYQWNLQKLVSSRQSEWFDTLETPGKYINQALSAS